MSLIAHTLRKLRLVIFTILIKVSVIFKLILTNLVIGLLLTVYHWTFSNILISPLIFGMVLSASLLRDLTLTSINKERICEDSLVRNSLSWAINIELVFRKACRHSFLYYALRKLEIPYKLVVLFVTSYILAIWLCCSAIYLSGFKEKFRFRRYIPALEFMQIYLEILIKKTCNRFSNSSLSNTNHYLHRVFSKIFSHPPTR